MHLNNAIYYSYSPYLYHHGVPGQKWGVRRYQNADGTLTDMGRHRYLAKGMESTQKSRNRAFIARIEGIAGGATAVAAGAAFLLSAPAVLTATVAGLAGSLLVGAGIDALSSKLHKTLAKGYNEIIENDVNKTGKKISDSEKNAAAVTATRHMGIMG